jgi:hypothetical protein
LRAGFNFSDTACGNRSRSYIVFILKINAWHGKTMFGERISGVGRVSIRRRYILKAYGDYQCRYCGLNDLFHLNLSCWSGCPCDHTDSNTRRSLQSRAFRTSLVGSGAAQAERMPDLAEGLNLVCVPKAPQANELVARLEMQNLSLAIYEPELKDHRKPRWRIVRILPCNMPLRT